MQKSRFMPMRLSMLSDEAEKLSAAEKLDWKSFFSVRDKLKPAEAHLTYEMRLPLVLLCLNDIRGNQSTTIGLYLGTKAFMMHQPIK